MNRMIFVLMLLLITVLYGCAESLVRVQPYEMEYFAQEKMQFVPLDSRAEFSEHIFSTREASEGGASGFQGGCGCR
jgi:hypothetical protein